MHTHICRSQEKVPGMRPVNPNTIVWHFVVNSFNGIAIHSTAASLPPCHGRPGTNHDTHAHPQRRRPRHLLPGAPGAVPHAGGGRHHAVHLVAHPRQPLPRQPHRLLGGQRHRDGRGAGWFLCLFSRKWPPRILGIPGIPRWFWRII